LDYVRNLVTRLPDLMKTYLLLILLTLLPGLLQLSRTVRPTANEKSSSEHDTDRDSTKVDTARVSQASNDDGVMAI
jgi:hypothetical protein